MTIHASLDGLDLDEFHSDEDGSARHRGEWLAWLDKGTRSAVTYFEIPPGCHLGAHVHDEEEVVLVLEGTCELVVEDRREKAIAPHLVVMPRGRRHDIVNTGSSDLRAVGFFPAPSVTTTFDIKLQPGNTHRTGSPDTESEDDPS